MIDPSIALQVRAPQFDNPLDSYSKFAQVQNAQNQNKLSMLAMQDRERGINDQMALTNAIRSNIDPNTGAINHEGVAAALGQSGSGHLIQDYQNKQLDNRKKLSDIGKTDSETQSKQVSTAKDVNQLFGSGAYAILQNPTYENAMRVNNGIRALLPPEMAKKLDGSDIPQDPVKLKEWAQNHYRSAIDADKQMQNQTSLDNAALQAKTSTENSKRTAASSKYSADSAASTARNRLTYDQSQPKGQIVQTDNGPILVDPRSGTGREVTGPDGKQLAGVTKPLNDSQSKALLFGSRMREADKILSGLEKEGTTTSIPGANMYGVGRVINALSSDNQQALNQAKTDFMTAVLRRESGASISSGEYDTANKQYFPQQGDSDKVIKQKARNRDLAIRGVLIEVPEKHRNSLAAKNESSTPSTTKSGATVSNW